MNLGVPSPLQTLEDSEMLPAPLSLCSKFHDPSVPFAGSSKTNCVTHQFSTGQLSKKAGPNFCVNKWAYFVFYRGSLRMTLNFQSSCWD